MNPPRCLLLIRHGLPAYRPGRTTDEPPGPPLSHVGRVQVEQAVGLVERLAPQAVYSSPLARAEQSARIVAAPLGLDVQIDSELREWHRSEHLYQVNQRSARWLAGWLRSGQQRAVVVGHASPLLAVIRSALYLPHAPWWHGNDPRRLVQDTADLFEFSMGAVFELVFEGQRVTARRRQHPEPRILHAMPGAPPLERLARRAGVENRELTRPFFAALVGCGRA